jgi:hypothetical protein
MLAGFGGHTIGWVEEGEEDEDCARGKASTGRSQLDEKPTAIYKICTYSNIPLLTSFSKFFSFIHIF